MTYTSEQWEYFSDWKNYSKEKDLQYSTQEFNFFINKLKNNEPFSLVRFGEGESRILLKEQNLQRTELSFDPIKEANAEYVTELETAAKINHKNYYVGIQSYTFKPAEKNRPENEFIVQRNKVISIGNLSREQYTCSRVFCNHYNRCIKDLLLLLKHKDVYVVCSENANLNSLGLTNIKHVWKISKKDAWKTDRNLYPIIVDKINSTKKSVLLCCAGFFGNILISKLDHNENFNINVGSVYDPLIFNRITRPYQRVKI